MNYHVDQLTRVRTIARNSGYNLIASLAPALAGLVGVRLLITGLGAERFGVLALTWTIINYSSLLDLGIGRALTQAIAKELGIGRDTSSSAWSGTCLLFCLGLAAGLVVALTSQALVQMAHITSAQVKVESINSLTVLAASLPFVFASSGINGILAAHQEFAVINAVRTPVSVANFVVPAIALRWTNNLAIITVLLVGIRVLSSLILFRCAWSRCMGRLSIMWSSARNLMRIGAWMLVSNIVSPLLVYLDRFAIAAVISPAAAAYYVTPYELATRLWMIPGAIMQGLFPAFATRGAQDQSQVTDLHSKGTKAIGGLLFVPCLIIVTMAHDFLTLWLSPAFGDVAYRALQFITIGVYINGIGQVAFGLIQAAGRPELTAKVHLWEAPPYVAALYAAARYAGISGVGFVWSFRVLVDTVILCHLASRFGGRMQEAGKFAAAVPVLAAGAIAGAYLDVWQRCMFVVVVIGFTLPCFYFRILSDRERTGVAAICLSKLRLLS